MGLGVGVGATVGLGVGVGTATETHEARSGSAIRSAPNFGADLRMVPLIPEPESDGPILTAVAPGTNRGARRRYQPGKAIERAICTEHQPASFAGAIGVLPDIFRS